MLAGRRMSEEEICPGELYHADENCVSDLVATVAPDIRVLLAFYCYHSSHLHTRGVAIAGSCDKDELVRIRNWLNEKSGLTLRSSAQVIRASSARPRWP